MARLHVYADESGNFDFSRKPGASRYFILTTVSLANHNIETELHDLRRDLAWRNINLLPSGEFHATEDKQTIRDEVFGVLCRHDFRIDATILDKLKARPKTRRTDKLFYQIAWYYHMKRVIPRIVTEDDELLVVAASLGTGAKKNEFYRAVRDVIYQCAADNECRTSCWPAASDPCLQVADYCSWALKRKWEDQDARSYNLIKDKIRSELTYSCGAGRFTTEHQNGLATQVLAWETPRGLVTSPRIPHHVNSWLPACQYVAGQDMVKLNPCSEAGMLPRSAAVRRTARRRNGRCGCARLPRQAAAPG